MSACGCTDQNVIFWIGLDGKLPAQGIPVNPTAEELAAQNKIVQQRMRLPPGAVITECFSRVVRESTDAPWQA